MTTTLLQRRRIHEIILVHDPRIPIPARLRLIHHRPDLPIVLFRQPHIQTRQILLQILQLLRPRDRDDILPLLHQPRQCQLPRRDSLSIGNHLQGIHQVDILGEIFVGEARGGASIVALWEVLIGAILAGEHAAAERRVSDDGDAEFTARLQKADLWVFDFHREGAVFDLYGADGMSFVGTAERGG